MGPPWFTFIDYRLELACVDNIRQDYHGLPLQFFQAALIVGAQHPDAGQVTIINDAV